MEQTINTRRVAKNTLYMYLRMIIVMVVSLYTARVIINALGIEDYGIYNIVGGVVVLFSFINTALRSSTQRFLSYELGRNDKDEMNKVFNVSLQCHAVYALVFLTLSLTIGLWFVITQLNIPEARRSAAIVVYIISIFTSVFGIFSAPFHASVIAYEKMSFYAFISIFEVLLKLVIVVIIKYTAGDKLIVYALSLMGVSVITLALSACYTFFKLKIGGIRLISDKPLFKKIFTFAGWSMFNGMTYVGAQQGGNILINIYNGVAANGAYAIANQVSNVLYSFVFNFFSAIEPQIVKSYSAGQHNEMFKLINRASYFSYYIFLFIAVPLVLEIDYVLEIWLGNTPEYAAIFCRLLFFYYLVDSIEAPLWMLIEATGKMKIYSLWSGGLTLLNIPISFVLLISGFSVYWVFIVRIILNVISSIIRPFYVHHLVNDFSVIKYIRYAISNVVIVSSVIGIGLIALLYIKRMEIVHPIILLFIAFFYTLLVVWVIGLKKEERTTVFKMIVDKIKVTR